MKTDNTLNQLQALYQKSQDSILEEFFSFLRFASISSEPEHKPHMEACVHWLREYIAAMGFDTELWPSEKGHQVLFASWLKAGPDKPTLLIYNHYDVQPVDPLELWHSDPFAPEVRSGEMYARGAQDNKGQCFYVLQALKLLLAKDGALPLNIKLCIEGEEECGSHALDNILNNKGDTLKADYLAVVDLGLVSPLTPTLTLGLRGIVTLDVAVIGSKSDLHSGSHGGISYNPIHALVEMLAKLRDDSGKITVPGFYDSVVLQDQKELEMLDLHFDAQHYAEAFGTLPCGGEKAFSPLESNWLRPTLEINGIAGGYAGSGFKTVIPSKAIAKISCRLVPSQDPLQIAQRVADFLHSLCPEGVKLEINIRDGVGSACRTSANSPLCEAFAKAFEEVFGNGKCHFIYSGASIPIVTRLAQVCGAEILLMGLGLEDDNIHAPNEHFGVERLEKGCLIMARGIERLG